ncbi:MAG: hypothetical protein ACLPVW_05945 [Terriglobales bacterium]
MSAGPQPETKKVGAVIYSSTNRPLRLPDFLAEFHRSWPHSSLEKTGKEPHRALFRVGQSDFALELHHTRVPQQVTELVVNSTLHWPMASAALAHHQAHLSVVGSAETRDVLGLACDLTKAIAALLPVTDALAVCWLSGPALNSAETFVHSAVESFGTGLYPISLWVAAHWDAQAGVIQTRGMAQFGAPEICLAQQKDATPLMVQYVFQVAQSVLAPHRQIADGDIIDSPHGRLRVKEIGVSGKRVLVLEPPRDQR